MSRVRRLGRTAALLLAVVAAAASCSPGTPADGARSPDGDSAYVYVVDWSGSTDDVRRRLLGAMLSELETLPPGTRIVVYRMASRTQEAYDGSLGNGGIDRIAATLAEDALGSDARKNTDFCVMAEALAGFAKHHVGGSFSVRVLTDGGDDLAYDRRARAAYKVAAAALCRDRRLVDVAFYGVETRFREPIRTAFVSAGERLRILRLGENLAR